MKALDATAQRAGWRAYDGGKWGGKGYDYGKSAGNSKSSNMEALEYSLQSTAATPADIDQKVKQLYLALAAAGKGEEACNHLKTSLKDVPREKVRSWHAYIYTLAERGR